MKKKILGMLLILAILFPYCEIQKNDVEAMSPPYLTENYEKDVIANDNAILDVELNNLERKQIYGFEIVLTSDGVETIRYQKKVSDNGEKVHVNFDIKNDIGIKLDSGREYRYTIRVVSGDSLNEDMYTLRNRFTTNNVKVVSTLKNVSEKTASVQLKIENSKKEKLKKVGIRLFSSNNKLLKDYSIDINKTDETLEYVFDLKADAGATLAQNKNYNYTTYVVLDVSDLHLYNAMSFDRGKFKTLGKATVKTKTYKSKKVIVFKSKISNPYKKRVFGIKVVILDGKKKYKVYNGKISKKSSRRKNQTITIKVKKDKIRKLLKKGKCKYITYVTVGGKVIKSRGKIKL